MALRTGSHHRHDWPTDRELRQLALFRIVWIALALLAVIAIVVAFRQLA